MDQRSDRSGLWKHGYVWCIPWLIYVIHSSVFWNWIVDDAGISYAFARNLADGYGLVPQPGSQPIESFSNLLWVFLLSILFFIKIFHPYISAKILAAIFTLGTFFNTSWVLRRKFKFSTKLSLFVLGLLSINSPFVRWANSGLENSLYVFALSCLLVAIFSFIAQPKRQIQTFLFGFLSACLVCIRPDGIVFLAVFPLLFIFKKKSIPPAFLYSFGVLTFLVILFVFRLWYFGEYLPVPFYAKGLSDPYELISFRKTHLLFRGIVGPLGLAAFLFFLGSNIFLWIKIKWGLGETLLMICFWLSVSIFFILPYDHLGIYRYASPFIYFAYVFGAVLVINQVRVFGKYERLIEKVIFISVGLGSVVMGALISQKHVDRPTVPFSVVAAVGGQYFNELANEANLEEGSLLTPDLGGALYYSSLEVHDFLGLVDKKMSRMFPHHPAAFYEYIFDDLEPSFIHLHGGWAKEANLSMDPRFSQDYVPIHAEFMHGEDGDIKIASYIRAELLDEEGKVLARLREVKRPW